MRGYQCAILAVFIAALPSANAVQILGSENNPELSDPGGDIAYADVYLGSRNHDYLDVLSVWLKEENGTLVVSEQVKDATSLESASADFLIGCNLDSVGKVGEEKYSDFRIGWFREPGSTETHLDVSITALDGKSIEPSTKFAARFEAPGQFVFEVPLESIKPYAESLTDFRMECSETMQAAGSSLPVNNADTAQSNAIFEIGQSATNISPGMQEQGPSSSIAGTVESNPPATEGLGTAVLLVACAGVAAAARKR